MEKKDILIVDDMEINRVILSQIFADRNHILEQRTALKLYIFWKNRENILLRSCWISLCL